MVFFDWLASASQHFKYYDSEIRQQEREKAAAEAKAKAKAEKKPHVSPADFGHPPMPGRHGGGSGRHSSGHVHR